MSSHSSISKVHTMQNGIFSLDKPNKQGGESDHFLKWLLDFVQLRWPTGITYVFGKTLGVGKISLSSVFPDFYGLWSKKGASIADCWLLGCKAQSWCGTKVFVENCLTGNYHDGPWTWVRPIWEGLWWRRPELSVKSALVHLTKPRPAFRVREMDKVSNFEVPKKVKIFTWSLLNRSPNTEDGVQRKFPHWSLSPSICLCFRDKKSLDRFSSAAIFWLENVELYFLPF